MAFTTTVKNDMLDAIPVGHMKLHSADPGATGVTAQITDAELDVTYAAATGSARSVESAFTIPVGAGGDVQFFSLWTTGGAVFLGSKAFATGETFTNAGSANITTATITLADVV
jgi:hypothetical protein